MTKLSYSAIFLALAILICTPTDQAHAKSLANDVPANVVSAFKACGVNPIKARACLLRRLGTFIVDELYEAGKIALIIELLKDEKKTDPK